VREREGEGREAGVLLGALRAEEVRRAGRKKKKEDGPRWAGMREGRERREVWGFSFKFFTKLFFKFLKFKLFSKI
jgi:hypothetical protein